MDTLDLNRRPGQADHGHGAVFREWRVFSVASVFIFSYPTWIVHPCRPGLLSQIRAMICKLGCLDLQH